MNRVQHRSHLLPKEKSMSINAPVSWGELVDKVTILEIKLARLANPSQLENVRRERAALEPFCERARQARPEVAPLIIELQKVNEALWEIEDEIRDHERQKDFGPRFIELARSVYRSNDHRAALKRQVNLLLDSELVEEKSYTAYD
jgi:hypothetical protein